MHARVIRNGPSIFFRFERGRRSTDGSGTETGWSSFKQSEDVSQIRRTCVRRRTRGACATTSKFLRAARAESLISQRRRQLDTQERYSRISHAGCSRSWRRSDVTDTWDSSRAAGSRATAGREANLNANQELATPRRGADFERTLTFARFRLFFVVAPSLVSLRSPSSLSDSL